MVFAVVEKAGTVVMNDNEELDSWSVIINGEVRIDQMDSEGKPAAYSVPRILKCGSSFGISPTICKKLFSYFTLNVNVERIITIYI